MTDSKVIPTVKGEVTRIINEAKKEVDDEQIKAFKAALKTKLKNLASAKKVVANIEREIADMEIAIAEDLSS